MLEDDPPGKRACVRAHLEGERDGIVLGTQLFGEFLEIVTQNHEVFVTPNVAAESAKAFSGCQLEHNTPELVRAAVRRSRSSLLSYWDSLIVETARSAGAAFLFTEDLQHGQEIDGLRIVNPFAAADA